MGFAVNWIVGFVREQCSKGTRNEQIENIYCSNTFYDNQKSLIALGKLFLLNWDSVNVG